jgi:hypothetical protein
MKSHLPRRDFVLSALIACGAPFLPGVAQTQTSQRGLAQGGTKRGPQVAAAYFGSGDADAVRVIGTAYLKSLGAEPTEEAILTAAADALQLIGKSPTQAAAVSALSQVVRRDFREQRSVQIEGWIISLTEAQLCALALLPQ